MINLSVFFRRNGGNQIKGKYSYYKHNAVQVNVTVNSGYAVKHTRLLVLAKA